MRRTSELWLTVSYVVEYCDRHTKNIPKNNTCWLQIVPCFKLPVVVWLFGIRL
ncbi:hypothetical protein [Nostoc sp. CMAA1605]|uniref:hypothetical protein n=1 Tax=Nostoc sp. CMAA1605 TaxID=2055159 RepID=UPI001F211EE9|nr:hypothetical protein [Nostoc sp. CMAA1605]